MQHEAVKEVAVVGAPHPVLGEDVVAFVVLHPGAHADTEELRAFGLEHLADYKVPRQFVFIDELPRNPPARSSSPSCVPASPPARPDHAGPSTRRTCDAPMNSAGFFAAWSRGCHSHSYTGPIMTEQNARTAGCTGAGGRAIPWVSRALPCPKYRFVGSPS